MEETERAERGVNRRQLLKRGAIVGGLAWTAPIIVQSISAPAGAQATPVDPNDGEQGDDDHDERDPGTASGSGIAPITEPVPPPPDAVSGQATFTG